MDRHTQEISDVAGRRHKSAARGTVVVVEATAIHLALLVAVAVAVAQALYL